MVPSGRIELPRPYEQQILSLPRLPIPPQGHIRQLALQRQLATRIIPI